MGEFLIKKKDVSMNSNVLFLILQPQKCFSLNQLYVR